MSDGNDELEKQAQAKLAQAWGLIREAGELAKQGQFYLHFGEVGEFIPSSFDDREKLRTKALEILKKDGKHNGGRYVYSTTETHANGASKQEWVSNPSTPFEELTSDQVEEELEKIIDGLVEELSYEAREYGERDTWWAPSRC